MFKTLRAFSLLSQTVKSIPDHLLNDYLLWFVMPMKDKFVSQLLSLSISTEKVREIQEKLDAFIEALHQEKWIVISE